jgi:hypothetical protein
MDSVILAVPGDLLGHLNRDELTELIRLLELARKRCGDTQAPVSCSGNHSEAGAQCNADGKSTS